jgi:Sel1 repeat
MIMVRTSLASLVFLVALSGCGIIDKLKGKDAAVAEDPAIDAAVAVEQDAAPAADAAVVASAAPASPPIIGACKAGDLADCTSKCEKLKSQTSCVNLGIMFADGNGVARDTGKASTLFQGACNAGVGAGCERFGTALHNGSGIVADQPRAADTFKKGCDLRNAVACNQLALMNVRGEGGAKDTVKAVSLFSKSCDLGDAFGCGNLANHLASGDGVPRDAARAATLRKAACDKGDQQACRALAASGADAGAPPPVPSGTASTADCPALKKVFMDTCQNSCAEKLAAKNFKKTDAERRLFCEGGCTSQMFNSPAMAKCKGK